MIPADVRPAYGKANETPTWPATLTSSQAKAAYGSWLEGVEARIEQIRRTATAEPVTLTHRQVQALAGDWYKGEVAAFEDEPGDPAGWEALLDELDFLNPAEAYEAHLQGRPYDGPLKRLPRLEREAGALLVAQGLAVTPATRAALLDRMHELFAPLCLLMVRRARGDYGHDRLRAALPNWEPPTIATSASPAAVTIDDLFNRYVAERKPAAAAVKSWKRQLGDLESSHFPSSLSLASLALVVA